MKAEIIEIILVNRKDEKIDLFTKCGKLLLHIDNKVEANNWIGSDSINDLTDSEIVDKVKK